MSKRGSGILKLRALRQTWVNNVLMIGMIIGFILTWWFETIHGVERNIAYVELGAKFNVAMYLRDEWWRLVTPMFLHADIRHLLGNLFLIYLLGNDIEYIIGHWRYAVFVLSAGIGGILCSLAFTPGIALGASTVCFGLFGAVIALKFSHPTSFTTKILIERYLGLFLINMAATFINLDIDMWGHLGGLLYGGIMTGVLVMPQGMRWRRIVQIGLTLLLCAISYFLYRQGYALLVELLMGY